MRLEVSVEGMTEQAQKIILRDLKSVISDYRTQEGLKRHLKIKEVDK